ncbi:MAG: peptidylprolyl isomerase [Prolixibacteraceae bacterium]|jgi:cyclophilin family peptidyl-prolyl cis-trans isomerase|nr:peptidylprolyl isomerase [Prolixibacteraceae bacterium]
MKHLLITSFVFLAVAAISSCSFSQNKPIPEGPMVLISTKYGNMKVVLYNQTPLHRDNFMKLTKEGVFDSLIFHRVIKGFMVQGGDPNSKRATKDQVLGDGDLNYTVPAEIVPGIIHKKGVIAAARNGDEENPERRSSATQFYLAQGKVYKLDEIPAIEQKMNIGASESLFLKMKSEKIDTLMLFQIARNKEGYDKLIEKLKQKAIREVEKNPVRLTKQQVETYTTLGGIPHLDGGYTVFGEVVDGFAVIDSIAAQPTGPNDRPLENIRMTIKVIKE